MGDLEENKLPIGANYYSSIGWNILPCHGIVNGRCTCNRTHGEPKEVGKHPVINQWNAESTSNSTVVQRWWEDNPHYNIGVHCSKSGFFVIDIDPRSGGPDSFLKFEEMVEGALPPTVEALTGAYSNRGGTSERGRHLFYKCNPGEGLIGNLKALGLDGIDIKHNGYVLITPSQHFSGVKYEWKPGHAPWEIEMADAPEELLSVLRKRRRSGGYSLGEGNWDSLDWERVDITGILEEGIAEGERAVKVYQVSCALANKIGTGDAERTIIETMMLRFNAEKITPPMEIEGPNSLLMHVNRAIDFVADNPKLAFTKPEVYEWQQKIATIMEDNKKELQPMLGVVTPPARGSEVVLYEEDDNYEAVVTADPDGTMSNPVAKMYRQKIESSISNGASILDASSPSKADMPKDRDSIDTIDGGVEGGRSLSDVGNGRRLVDTFGSGVRYTSGLGWFVWENGYWKPDMEDLGVTELAKRISGVITAEGALEQNPNEQNSYYKWAQQARSNARLKGAIESAKSDPRIKIPVDEWDRDDNLLGVLNGVIDLRTGDLLKGRPDLLITRRAPVSYTRGHRNVRWENFLDDATQGDKQLQGWLQKAAGYTISGSNKYDIMFLVYGPPGSGKNTFVEAIVKCLGTQQYSWPLDSTILAHNDGNTSSTDLYHWAQLRGRRMVWVDELPESERIKENAVKKLTGSSEISARSPGEQPFTFDSKAKLWVSTNNRPIITDDAMWRRIRPVPFEHKPTTPDPSLKEFIFDPEGGLPAVLSWAVEGAIKIINSKEIDALGWCPAVSDAAEMYRKNEDRIGLFLQEETEESHQDTKVSDIFTRYRDWSMTRGERSMTQIAFQRKLADKGIKTEGVGSRALMIGRALIANSGTSEAVWANLINKASQGL